MLILVSVLDKPLLVDTKSDFGLEYLNNYSFHKRAQVKRFFSAAGFVISPDLLRNLIFMPPSMNQSICIARTCK